MTSLNANPRIKRLARVDVDGWLETKYCNFVICEVTVFFDLTRLLSQTGLKLQGSM